MAPEPNEYDIELSAYVKLTRAESALQGRILDHHPLSAGMTLSQFGVLEALLHKGRLSHHDAARKILKTPGNITSVVDQLERSGLVERRRCETDRRRVFLELTDRGKVTARTAFERMRNAIRDEMSVLTREELVELSRLCKKLGTARRYPIPGEGN